MATKKIELNIEPIKISQAVVRICGDTPLIMHAWSEKAKKEMLAAQQGRKKGKAKEIKNPVRDFVDSIYWLGEKPVITADMTEEESYEVYNEFMKNNTPRFGFPVTAIKQAAISAAYRLGWSKDKMSIRGVFFIEDDEDGLVEIHCDDLEMREDMVKIGMGTADLRYRGELRNWHADLKITYNENSNYDINSIMNMLNAGGYVCGIGEWRPERDGNNGRFHVVL